MRGTNWIAAILVTGLAVAASAHFQALLPSTDMVERPGRISLNILFTHPMEQGPIMNMGKPKRFGALLDGRKQDLLGTLKARKLEGKTAYTAEYEIRRPGDHVFFLEPAPYWEPVEGKMIVHYTKVVVNSMGEEVGWDAMAGLPVEIEPLVRPYGLWTGNAFRGIVKVNGKPEPFAEIEVEYWNEGRKVAIPADPFITQVIKADGNGVFSYTMPRAGWWAFAALVEGERKIRNPDGEMVPVELGGLMWVRCADMR